MTTLRGLITIYQGVLVNHDDRELKYFQNILGT